MHLPAALLERLRVGLGTAAILGAAGATGCASAHPDTAQAPFAGMGSRANPAAPTVQVIAPGTTPFAQPVRPVRPVRPVQPVQPVAAPAPEPVSSPIVAPPVDSPKTWECGPCGMG